MDEQNRDLSHYHPQGLRPADEPPNVHFADRSHDVIDSKEDFSESHDVVEKNVIEPLTVTSLEEIETRMADRANFKNTSKAVRADPGRLGMRRLLMMIGGVESIFFWTEQSYRFIDNKGHSGFGLGNKATVCGKRGGKCRAFGLPFG